MYTYSNILCGEKEKQSHRLDIDIDFLSAQVLYLNAWSKYY